MFVNFTRRPLLLNTHTVMRDNVIVEVAVLIVSSLSIDLDFARFLDLSLLRENFILKSRTISNIATLSTLPAAIILTTHATS